MSQTESSIALFIPSLPPIPPAFSALLDSYSNIPSDAQPSHILSLRDRACKHYPYPCLGRWRFLDLDLSAHPLYQTVLEALSADVQKPEPGADGETVFLDLGCCIGQDLRKLIFDLLEHNAGTQSQDVLRTRIVQKVFGADLRPEFIQLGYELFGDESALPRSQFISPADVFDLSPDNALSKLDGKVNVLNCTAVFHLFGWEAQQKVADRCLKLMKKRGKRLLVGAQTANVTADEYPRRSGGSRYRHNEESWRTLWEDVVKDNKWSEAVKSIEVGSELQERSMDSRRRDKLGGKEVLADVTGAGNGEERRKMIGNIEEGFRWQVWWVWVDFR